MAWNLMMQQSSVFPPFYCLPLCTVHMLPDRPFSSSSSSSSSPCFPLWFHVQKSCSTQFSSENWVEQLAKDGLLELPFQVSRTALYFPLLANSFFSQPAVISISCKAAPGHSAPQIPARPSRVFLVKLALAATLCSTCFLVTAHPGYHITDIFCMFILR